MSSRAFSANSGQLEAGSTTTASSFLPSRPPFLFCSSMSMSITSFSVVSLMAMVPESEWRMPTLIVSWALAGSAAARPELTTIKIGMTGTAEIVVGEEHTAPRIGSGMVRVLATPVMINVMEAAALDAIEHLLPEGHQSLGTHLDIGHYAATPVGMRLRATAEVTKVDGRTVEFRVEAHDEKERVGDGTHTRVVVNVERFDKRVQKKLQDRS